MNGLVDIIIILFLILGAIIGFKRGFFKSAVMFFGTIIVLVLSFYLKNPLSRLMYTYLPFFDLGVKTFNIILYEALAFLIIYIILMSVLQIIIKVTGLFEKILKFTIILGIPSKILGAIFGLFEEYIIIFLLIFILSHVSFVAPYISESKLAPKILSSSPLISNLTSDYYASFEEIYSLKEKYNNTSNKDEYEQEALDILLKYEIINPDSALKLIEKNKLDFEGAKEIVENYEGE